MIGQKSENLWHIREVIWKNETHFNKKKICLTKISYVKEPSSSAQHCNTASSFKKEWLCDRNDVKARKKECRRKKGVSGLIESKRRHENSPKGNKLFLYVEARIEYIDFNSNKKSNIKNYFDKHLSGVV